MKGVQKQLNIKTLALQKSARTGMSIIWTVVLTAEALSSKEVLGHKTLPMILRHAHLAPSHKVRVLDLLDSAVRRGGTAEHS